MTRDRHFEPVTTREPCKICAATTWCARLEKFHLCMRVESNRPSPKGGWYHPRNHDAPARPTKFPPPKPRPTDEELRERWEPLAQRFSKNGLDKLPDLALQLGVRVESLVKLGVGYADEMGFGPACYTFPERNPDGHVIGIQRRMADGGKLFGKGGRRGLSYCDGWQNYQGAIWILEGGSDVAAALSLGLCAIGRPSNIGGVEMLSKMLKPYPNRKIVVAGENDHKTDVPPPHDPECQCCLRCWPGRAGAMQVAQALAKRLRRPVDIAMPPEIKDFRAYTNFLGTNARKVVRTLRMGRFPAT